MKHSTADNVSSAFLKSCYRIQHIRVIPRQLNKAKTDSSQIFSRL